MSRTGKRYRLVCVADGQPDHGSYDDLDEAIVNSDAHYEVYDTETGEWPGATCQEEWDAAAVRWTAKRQAAQA